MNIPEPPKTLTKIKAEGFKKAFGYYLDPETQQKDVFKSPTFDDKATNTHYSSVEEFDQDLERNGIDTKKTNIKHIGIILENWYESFSKVPEYTGESRTNEQPAGTTPGEINLQEQVEALGQKRKAQEIREQSDRQVREAIAKKQELYEQFFKGKKVVVVPEEKIPTVELTKEDKEKLFAASKEAKENPATTKEFIKGKIQESISQAPQEYQETITEPIIEKTAYSITQDFISLPDYKTADEIPDKIPVMRPESPILALTDLNDERLKGLITDEEARKIAVQRAQEVALGMESDTNIKEAALNSFLGSQTNITPIFCGPKDGHITQFTIADNQEEQRDEGIEIDFKEMYDTGKKWSDIWNKINTGEATVSETATTTLTYAPTYTAPVSTAVAAKTTATLTKSIPTAIGAAYGFRQGALAAQWARSGIPLLMNPRIVGLISSGSLDMTPIMSSVVMTNPTQLVIGKFAIGFQTGTLTTGGTTAQVGYAGVAFGEKYVGILGVKGGSQVAVAKVSSQAAAKGTTALATKAGTQVAIEALPAASGFLSKVLGFLGLAGTPVGAAIMTAVGAAVGKIIEKIDWTKVKKWISENGPVLAVGMIGGGLLLRNPFLLAGGGTLGAATIATGGLKTVGAGFLGVWAGIRFLFRNLIGPAVVAPIAITMLVLPVLVAFIMFVINSGAYIVPPSPLSQLSENPYIEVIKTGDPGGPFENTDLPITVKYTITVRAKKGTLTNLNFNHTCKVVREEGQTNCEAPLPDTPESISPSSVFTFEYEQTYGGSNYEDSIVFNTFSVEASTEDGAQYTSGSESIIIGDPPTQCLSLDGNWPGDRRTVMENAKANLAGSASTFLAQICLKMDSVSLRYNSAGDGNLWGKNHGSYIDFFPKGLGDDRKATYILAHELGHTYASLYPEIYMQYERTTGIKSEIPFCFYTYRDKTGAWPFSERFPEAISLTIQDYCGNFSSSFPKHYDFVQNHILK